MRKQVFIYILLICMSVMFGCNKEDKNGLENNDIIDNSDNIDGNNTNGIALDTYEIELLTSLIYKSDEEVINVLGTGNEVFNQNSNAQSFQREYSFVLEGEEVTTTIVYDDGNIVSGIYTYLPDNDRNKWEKVLSNKLGYPTKLLQVSNTNSEVYTATWKIDSALVTLFGTKNSLSIQIE